MINHELRLLCEAWLYVLYIHSFLYYKLTFIHISYMAELLTCGQLTSEIIID